MQLFLPPILTKKLFIKRGILTAIAFVGIGVVYFVLLVPGADPMIIILTSIAAFFSYIMAGYILYRLNRGYWTSATGQDSTPTDTESKPANKLTTGNMSSQEPDGHLSTPLDEIRTENHQDKKD